MTATVQNSMRTRDTHWLTVALTFAFVLGFGVAPVFAQNGGQSQEDAAAKKQKIEQLKKSFATGLKAAKANNHTQAYTQLEQALRLAQEIEQSNATNKISGYLQKLPKNWGNSAIENQEWSNALTHFDKGIKHAENDAYMYYGKGLALVNMDSTEAGLNTLSEAIEVGNRTGNTRVTGLATERIRDEFLARASKALNDENPTTSQANTALDAIEEMEQYVEPNATALFYRSRAQFELGEYQQAIETAQAGLNMHQGSRSDAAKYHFIVAESHMQLGNEGTACQRFQQATFGDYKPRAEHYLKNECE